MGANFIFNSTITFSKIFVSAEQFGPCLQWPWTKLTDVTDLDDALNDRIVEQSDAQAAGRSVSELEEERDANLVAMLKALRREDTAAGAFLNRLGAASA